MWRAILSTLKRVYLYLFGICYSWGEIKRNEHNPREKVSFYIFEVLATLFLDSCFK